MQNACKMNAFCCIDTLPVKTAIYILHTVCILLLSLILDISGFVWCAFGVRSGCVRGAFGVRSHNCITRAGIFSTFWVTKQVYSRCPGSLYRCFYDVSGHFTSVFTLSRVIYRCTYDVPGHFTGVLTMSRVTLQVYLRYPGSLYRCVGVCVCVCVCVHVCVWMCECMCGGICLWCDAEWCGYACGVMQNGVNMPVVWCRIV